MDIAVVTKLKFDITLLPKHKWNTVIWTVEYSDQKYYEWIKQLEKAALSKAHHIAGVNKFKNVINAVATAPSSWSDALSITQLKDHLEYWFGRIKPEDTVESAEDKSQYDTLFGDANMHIEATNTQASWHFTSVEV